MALRAPSAWVCARLVARWVWRASGRPVEAAALQAVQRQVGKVERLQRRGQRVRRVERQAERIVERGLGDIQIGGPIDALLRDRGQVHADGEHIHIGGHAGGADRFGALQVGFGGANGLLRGLQVLRRQDGAVVGARRLRR